MPHRSSITGRSVSSRVAERVANMPHSAVRTILDAATALEANGRSIIHLEIGRPWFDTPLPIKDAAKAALDAGYVHYSPNRGIGELRHSIAKKLAAENGLTVDPESELLVTTGNKQATFLAIMTLINPGDEVIVGDPQYSPHAKEVELAGGIPKFLPLTSDNDWRIDPDALKEQITSKTKLIFLNTPHNPTGRVYTRSELDMIATAAVEHDLLVLTDETYEYIVYDNHQHFSLGSFPGMQERTISTFAFTKSFAMDGWRLGFLAAPAELVSTMVKIVQLNTAAPNTFAQYGAITAIRGGRGSIEDMRRYDEQARDLIVSRLDAMGLPCNRVEGTIHAFPDLTPIHSSSEEAARILLDQCGIAATPGTAYGAHGRGRVRFSFGAVTHTDLDEALSRMEKLGR